MADELHYLELLELTRRIHAKQISPLEATKAELDRIDVLDKTLRSYALVTADSALEQAREAEAEISRGMIRGPLHGAPIAVKDLCWTKGVPTAAGMPIHRDFRPDQDATVVKKLRDAGAIILGKLQLTEGAYADHHPDIEPPVNPWNAAHWSGASSSGSGVATAAGLCYGSLGSDTGGSIRFPSAANGVTGLKPTWGRVSRYGVFELAASLDHIGPIARSAADAAALLGAIAGRDDNDPTASLAPVPDYLSGIEAGIRGLRVGVDPNWNRTGTDARMIQAVDEAIAIIRTLGGNIREVNFPDPTHVIAEWPVHCGIETAVAHESTYPARKAEYGPALSGLIELGRDASAMQYQKILLHRHDFSGRLRALFETIDLLLIPAQPFASPTTAGMATLGEDPEKLLALLRYTCPFDVSGSPTITLPCGFTEAGTPIAFQFVASHFREEVLCRAGYAYQTATDWHHRHPKLVTA
ncbi:amidase [Acidiphilium sp.]|uniref:amidase n=1 Tax=Acidiphilium sp. TaxID=527 RepID=UPI002589C35B|nr:amidase [Acidiphilium sp.]